MTESTSRSMETDVNQVLDDALEKLRWCREHLQDRNASETLRQLEAKLGYLAQALTWDMDGEGQRARVALSLALGGPRRQSMFVDPHDPSSWDQDWWLHGH
jgi:hypothetical protein